MWLMLAGLAGVCGGGCRGEDLTAPRGAAPAPARVLVVADTLCVRAQFTITGPTSVTTNFPTAAECPSGLVLTRSQPATWVQTPNRRLRLLVRFRNLTGQAVQLPVRLYLPATGTTVVLPAGTPPSKVVAYQPDSSEAGGGRVWFVGGSSVLAAGDSTAEDTLTFQVQSPVTKARWQFQATVASVGSGSGVPALPPDSISSATWLALHDTLNLEPASAAYPIPFPRNLILVTLRENTPLGEKQAAIDAIGGQVVGGNPIGNGGVYYVTIASDGTTTPLFNAIAQLKSLPQVLLATPELVPLSPGYLRPTDGLGWQPADWRVGPNDAPSGANWALEAIRGPLAWGCETGDSLTKVGVLDTQFDSLPEFVGIVDPSSAPLYGTPGALGHGTAVLSVLSANGNNGLGISGIMWRSRAFIREVATRPGDATSHTASGIVSLTRQGVRVINLSQWLDWELYKGVLGRNRPVTADTVHVNHILRQLVTAIRNANGLPGAAPPLIVLIAGNKPIDAYMNGLGGLVDTFPQQVLVVGGSDSLGQLYDSSGRGPRVELVAPAVGVATLDRAGTPRTGTGTSVAAPLVSGVAGLLLSFDPTLTAAQLKTLLVDGAVIGGSTAGGIPILNAYESLRLAAQRPGAPVCGNRMWRRGLNVVVRRTPTVTDTFRWTAPDTVIALLGPHGGKYLGARNAKGWLFQGGQWVFTQAPTFTASGSRTRASASPMMPTVPATNMVTARPRKPCDIPSPPHWRSFRDIRQAGRRPRPATAWRTPGGTGSGINCSWRCTRRSWTRRPTCMPSRSGRVPRGSCSRCPRRSMSSRPSRKMGRKSRSLTTPCPSSRTRPKSRSAGPATRNSGRWRPGSSWKAPTRPSATSAPAAWPQARWPGGRRSLRRMVSHWRGQPAPRRARLSGAPCGPVRPRRV